MTADQKKTAHIIVVHGVQSGNNAQVTTHKRIEALLKASLEAVQLKKEYEVIGYLYEDMNDKAQKVYQRIGKAIATGRPLVGDALHSIIDIAGDVITSAAQTSTAKEILDGLIDRIEQSYAEGHPAVLVSHSLGTVYSLDAVNALMTGDNRFMGDDMSTWPVRGLITMGSPLGLDINLLDRLHVFEKRKLNVVKGADFCFFKWTNFYNPLDPVVGGSLFGKPIAVKGSKGPVELRYENDVQPAHWMLQGQSVVSEDQWLMAHESYYNTAKVGDEIMKTLWG
jgi:hypothetical protein